MLGTGTRVDFVADTVLNRADNQAWPNAKDVLYFELLVAVDEDAAATTKNGDTATLSGAVVLAGETIEFGPMVFTVVEPELEPLVAMKGYTGSNVVPWSDTNETVDSLFSGLLLLEATVNVAHANTSLAPAMDVELTVDFNTSAAEGVGSLTLYSTTLLDHNGLNLNSTTLAGAALPGADNVLPVNASWASKTYILVNISKLADRDTVCVRAAPQWSQPTPGPTVDPKRYPANVGVGCFEYLTGFGSEVDPKNPNMLLNIVGGAVAGVLILGLAIAGLVVRRRSGGPAGGLDVDDATIAKMDPYAVTGRPISTFELDASRIQARRQSPGSRPLSKIAGSVHGDRKPSTTNLSQITDWNEDDEDDNADSGSEAGEENPYGMHGQLKDPVRSRRSSLDASGDAYANREQLRKNASGDNDEYENALSLLRARGGGGGGLRAGSSEESPYGLRPSDVSILSTGDDAAAGDDDPREEDSPYGINGSLLYGKQVPATTTILVESGDELDNVDDDGMQVYRLSEPSDGTLGPDAGGGEEWAPMTALFVARASQRVKSRSRHRSSAAAMASMPGAAMFASNGTGGAMGAAAAADDDDDDNDFGDALLQLMDHGNADGNVGRNRPRAGSTADVVLSGEQLDGLHASAAASAAAGGNGAGTGSVSARQLSFDTNDVLGFRIAMPSGFGSCSGNAAMVADDATDGRYIVVGEGDDGTDSVARGVFTPVLQESSEGGDYLNRTSDGSLLGGPASATMSDNDFVDFANSHDSVHETGSRRASVVDLV